MNFLGSHLLIPIAPIALLIGQAAQVPRVLLDAAEPIAVATPPLAAPVTHWADLPRDFPTKIWVQSKLRETVSRMWAASPTFRQQCLRVQRAGAIQVQLRLDPELASHPEHRATCELRLYSSGGIIASVRVAPERTTELIAHEMEHVCERLDGIKVEEEARAGRPGYYRINGKQYWSYETDRAVRVGRQVAAEADVAVVWTKAQ